MDKNAVIVVFIDVIFLFKQQIPLLIWKQKNNDVQLSITDLWKIKESPF